MGKWSRKQYDDVLSSKFKSLVSGAIDRSKLEKIQPMISYETFVQDLDAGDSFTTGLIEILVKELAERISRPDPNSKRLIADKTAKNLRLLATPLRVYRERQSYGIRSHRRSVNLTDYLNPPPNGMDIGDDSSDDLDNLLGGPDSATNNLEGVSSSAQELHDALHYSPWVNVTTSNSNAFRMPEVDPSPLSSPLSRSPTPPAIFHHTSSPSWSLPLPAPGSTNNGSSRTAGDRSSLRRRPLSIGTRTLDFNDFTSRRRASARDRERDRDGESAQQSMPNSEVVAADEDEADGSRSPPNNRRFPFARTIRTGSLSDSSSSRRHSSSPNAHWLWPIDRSSSNSTATADSTSSHELPRLDFPSTAMYSPRLRRSSPRPPSSERTMRSSSHTPRLLRLAESRHASPLLSTPLSSVSNTATTGALESGGLPTPPSNDNEPL